MAINNKITFTPVERFDPVEFQDPVEEKLLQESDTMKNSPEARAELARKEKQRKEQQARIEAQNAEMAVQTPSPGIQRPIEQPKQDVPKVELQGPSRLTEIPDFSGITERAQEQALQRSEQATKATEDLLKEQREGVTGIQAKLQEDTRKLQEKAEKDTEERIARQDAIREKIDQENLARRATETRNISNAFSQQLAMGKDSGFVNALNMSAVRSANKTYADSKLNLDLQFMQDTNNIYNKEFETVFRLEEGLMNKTIDLDIQALDFSTTMKQKLNDFKDAVQAGADNIELQNLQNEIKYEIEAENDMWSEWNSSAKSALDFMIEEGNIEGAMQFAEQASEISNHPYFQMMQQTDYVNALRQNSNLQVMDTWKDTLNQINGMALNASNLDPAMQEEQFSMMYSLMARTPDQASTFMKNVFSNFSEDDLSRYKVSELDEQIKDDFIQGKRTWEDESVRSLFSRLYSQDAAFDSDQEARKAILTDSGITQEFIDSNALGNELTMGWLESIGVGDISDQSAINVNLGDANVFGQADIASIELFGREITDVDQLADAAGIDISFEGFAGDEGTRNYEPDIWTDQYKPKDAYGDKFIGGQVYSNGDLIDSYLEYFKSFQDKWRSASTTERVDMGEPLNKNDWANRLRNENKQSGQKTDLKSFNSGLLKDPTVIDSARGTFTLSDKALAEVSERTREDVKQVLDTGDANFMRPEDFAVMFDNPEIRRLLQDQNTDNQLFLEIDQVNTNMLARGKRIDQKDNALSTANIGNVISKLKYNSGAGTYSGNVIYDGGAYKISARPGRFKKSPKSKNWQSVAYLTLTPIGGGKTIEFATVLDKPDGSQANFGERKNASQQYAERWFEIGGRVEDYK